MAFPFVNQNNNNDCALACFAMIYQFYFKRKIDLNDLKEKYNLLTNQAISLTTLKMIANNYNLSLLAYKISFAELTMLKLQKPLVLQIINKEFNYHFVTVYHQKKQHFLMADPSESELIWIHHKELAIMFTGIVINFFIVNKNTKNQFKSKNIKLNLFLVPKYFIYATNVLVSNLILVAVFFLGQVAYKIFINQIVINNSFDQAFLILIIFLLINLIHVVISFIFENLSQNFYYYFVTSLIKKIYQKWFLLKPLVVSNFNSSYYLQLHQDVTNVGIVFTHNFLELIINFVTMIAVTVFLISINWIIFLITCFTGLVNVIFSFMMSKKQKPMIKRNLSLKLLLNNELIETINSFEDCYLRNLLPHLETNLTNRFSAAFKANYLVDKVRINTNLFHNFIKHIINFASMLVMLFLLFHNNLMFSQLIFISAINTYALNFYYNIGSFCYFYSEFIKSFMRINDFLQLATKNNKSLASNKDDVKVIDIKNCFFNINDKNIFNNLNLTIIGHNLLLGNNGIGKTTLLSLISKKYQKFTGIININNNNINNISDAAWQAKCIYLNANSYIMLGTVLENILSFQVNSKNLQLLKTLEIEAILANLNVKLTDYCQYRGANLSQGQKQVILFLTLFFGKWEIILLDEALSNIKYELKTDLLKKLIKYYPKQVIIYVSHDPTLKKIFNNTINLTSLLEKHDNKD